MKPQKRCIRDFFLPVSRSSQEAQKSASLVKDVGNAQASQSTLSSISKTQHASPRILTSTQSPRTASNSSTASNVLTTTRATSADAQPPNPSQSSAKSGASKRIVSNGEQAVLNSDSDSDSTPYLDWPPGLGVLKTRSKVVAPTTRSKRTWAHIDDDLRKPKKKGTGDRQSFNVLVRTAQQNREIERSIIQHKADLDKSFAEPTQVNVMINEDMLGQVVEDDDDDPERAHRLFLAMQRTNATQTDSAFHFFEDTSNSDPVQPPFPFGSLPDLRWASSFEDSTMREQAFLTGFAHQIFRLQELPEEVASWMLDQICVGRNKVLNTKYFEILDSHHAHIETLLDKNRLNAMFRVIGANVEVLDSTAELAPSSDLLSTSRPLLPPSLKSILRFLASVAPWLRTKARSHALYILCHVCLDDRVIADADILGSIQDAFEAIICNFTGNSRLTTSLDAVVSQLLLRVIHPILQKNLIRALPARSPLTAYFQRHLALSFLLHPHVVDLPLVDTKLPVLIHSHLNTSPQFQINKDTDYGHLVARLTLLDTAIGPGLLPVPYQPLISPTPSQAGSSPVMAPFPVSSEVKDFNTEVDALAQHIKFLGNSIVEAGAVVDLTILEAKDCIERLCSRLEHAVRIGGKKVHNVFGYDDEDKQSKVSKFFPKTRKTLTRAPRGHGIFAEEDDTGTGLLDTLET